MKAIIPCAGYATRLYPLTLHTPKHLLPIGSKVILDHVVEQIQKLACIDEIILVTNARFYDQFKQWATKKEHITVLNDGTQSNDDRLGTIGDLCFVLKIMNCEGDILILLGDNLFEFSLKEMFTFYLQKNASSVALFDIQKPELATNFGIAELDQHGRIIGFEEKPSTAKTTLVSTGCYLLKEEDVHLIHEYHAQQKKDNMGEFIGWLARQKNVFGYQFSGIWFDIGSHEHYSEARKRFGS